MKDGERLLTQLGELRPGLERAEGLNAQMQALFRRWHDAGRGDNPAVMLDQGKVGWFHALNSGLHDALDDAGVRQRMRDCFALLERLAAGETIDKAAKSLDIARTTVKTHLARLLSKTGSRRQTDLLGLVHRLVPAVMPTDEQVDR